MKQILRRSGRSSPTRIARSASLLTLAFLSLALDRVSAQTFLTLYNFTGRSDGGYVLAPVVRDASGDLYGTTWQGGDMKCSPRQGCGTVFKVTTRGTESVVHAFTETPDAAFAAASLVQDNKGSFYGTTSLGGASGYGAVFKVDKSGSDAVLYSFTGGKAGQYPSGGLVLDKAGNLYGTTWNGGDLSCDPSYGGCGVVFRVSQAGKFRVLHRFHGNDGAHPAGNLLLDQSGNLYGTTPWVAAGGFGALYKVSPSGKATVLYTFCQQANCSDGLNPSGGVIRDSKGNIYGVTSNGGDPSCGCGVVFKLDQRGRETVLHAFSRVGDGANPIGPLLLDANTGAIYGTANLGGNIDCNPNGGGGPGCGTIFELDADAQFIVLHQFEEKAGRFPNGGLVIDPSGNLYGTTQGNPFKGAQGSVFELVP